MFRLQNNLPEVYVNNSRDFQLFCRLYDVVFNGVKFSIDSIDQATSTMNCDHSLLQLLKTKVGLFRNVENVSEKELRYVLSAFPTIIRYKGSMLALDYILTLYTRITNASPDSWYYDVDKLRDEYKLVVTCSEELAKGKLLMELLQMVMPTGYIVEQEISSIEVTRDTPIVHDELEYELRTNAEDKHNNVVNDLSQTALDDSDNVDIHKLPQVGTSALFDKE